MFHFLRRIRHSLLVRNKFSSYLAYALGEIILVVIGILIALMINSWWQGKKDHTYEYTVIKEIQSAFERDLGWIELLDERNVMREESISIILQAIESGASEMDSILYKAYQRTNLGTSYTYDPSIYESLKVKGLELIRKDSVRNMIIQMYELYQPRAKYFIDTFDQDRNQPIIIQELEEDLFAFVPNKSGEGIYKLIVQPKRNILQDPRLIRILLLNQEEVEYHRFRLDGISDRLKDALRMLDKELESDDP